MIYISTGAVRATKISQAVEEIASHGFKNIELTGGTDYYDGYLEDLFELKEKYNLQYLCHNYFPPPREHFVLNFASLNEKTFAETVANARRSIEDSKALGCDKIGFHAGFLIDIKASEIGRKLSKNQLFDRKAAVERFITAIRDLKEVCGDLLLYIENNVYSHSNYQVYGEANPLLITDSTSLKEISDLVDFKVLLDVAHLKVSCKTLGLDFKGELNHFLDRSDYIHISDNDGLHDQNLTMSENSQLYQWLAERSDLREKTYTLEIYQGLNAVRDCHDLLQALTTQP